MNSEHNSQKPFTDDASADFLLGGSGMNQMLENEGITRDDAKAMITGQRAQATSQVPDGIPPDDNPPARPPVENADLLASIDPNQLGAEVTSQQPPTPGANLPVDQQQQQQVQQQREYKYDFGTSHYRNDAELKVGVAHKDEIIANYKTKESEWESNYKTLREQLEAERAQMNVVTGLYADQLPDEESQIDTFARALLPEEFRNKTENDFILDPEDYIANDADYSVSEEDYEDDDDFSDALNQARARRIKRQKTLDKKLREDQLRMATEMQRFIRERENARSLVSQQIEDQKRQATQVREDSERRLVEAGSSLREELTEDALGLRNPEDYTVLQDILYNKPVPTRITGEVVERSMAEVLVQMRADYGRSVTDLMIKGLRHEIRGDSPTSAPTRAFSAQSLRGARAPALSVAPVNTESSDNESQSMFEEAGFA